VKDLELEFFLKNFYQEGSLEWLVKGSKLLQLLAGQKMLLDLTRTATGMDGTLHRGRKGPFDTFSKNIFSKRVSID
jgi:hypothetical protein